MSVDIIGTENDLVTVKVSGLLAPADWAPAQQAMAELIQEHGKTSLLVLADGFQGWAPGEEWDDQSFFETNDPFMERIAIVGEKKWEEPVLMFAGKGFRRCLVEYFLPEQTDQARAWVMEQA